MPWDGTYLDPLAGGGRAALDLPLAVPDHVQAERLGDLRRRRRVEEVLLVGEDEHRHADQLVLGQQLGQLLAGLVEPLTVEAVDHIDLPGDKGWVREGRVRLYTSIRLGDMG